MDERYPNPETAWHSERGARPVDRGEIERRIGVLKREDVIPLSGGLANDSFRIGADRVLRIYRRDLGALQREALLLSRDWRHFRVPHVLVAGEDFLLLEYLEHEPLRNSREQGLAAGAAAAEIHSTRYDRCGLFGEGLEVNEAWEDFPTAVEDYVRSQVSAIPQLALVLERVADCIVQRRDVLRLECATPVLLHGDFKASNLHWGRDGRLLVLDWEFAYAGPRMMDLGQLCRWGMPEPFRGSFELGYVQNGGRLPRDWKEQAGIFDLVNLVGLLSKSADRSRQSIDCRRRMDEILIAAYMQ